MESIIRKLKTGVTTTQNTNGGEIKVTLSDYDNYFDQPTIETELANNTRLLLCETFQNLQS